MAQSIAKEDVLEYHRERDEKKDTENFFEHARIFVADKGVRQIERWL